MKIDPKDVKWDEPVRSGDVGKIVWDEAVANAKPTSEVAAEKAASMSHRAPLNGPALDAGATPAPGLSSGVALNDGKTAHASSSGGGAWWIAVLVALAAAGGAAYWWFGLQHAY